MDRRAGSYTFDGGNLGSLTLTTTTQDGDGNNITSAMSYKFAVSASEIQTIRTDGANLSVGTMFPASATLSGAFVFTQLQSAQSTARVVAFNVDTLGNVTGTSVVRDFGSVAASNVSGNYTAADDGTGRLTFSSSQVVDEDGNLQMVSESYAVVAGKDRAVALRTDGGTISLIQLSR